MHARIFLFIIIFVVFQNAWAMSADKPAAAKAEQAQENKEVAGELFGVKVPMENYSFVRDVVKVFGNKWGKQPKTPEEFKDVIWEQLLLSFVAFSQNVDVSRDELANEITKMLAEDRVAFDWKKDPASFEKWVRQKTGEPVDLFQNQLSHLIQIQKLRDGVMEGIKPDVFDKEALQKYMDASSLLSLEFVKFGEQKDADEFYKRASGGTDIWEKEKKKRPADFVRPGLASLESLMTTWRVPRDAVMKMMQRESGAIYPPRPMGKNYAVFKILEKKPADESQFPQAKDPYYVDLTRRKKYEGLNDWLKQLKDQANIKIYTKEGGKA